MLGLASFFSLSSSSFSSSVLMYFGFLLKVVSYLNMIIMVIWTLFCMKVIQNYSLSTCYIELELRERHAILIFVAFASLLFFFLHLHLFCWWRFFFNSYEFSFHIQCLLRLANNESISFPSLSSLQPFPSHGNPLLSLKFMASIS